MGAPISVEHHDDPTESQVDELHARYCSALIKLFNEHKTKFGILPDVELNIY